ncbi:F-box/LRR-repeat protein 25-like [Apium graveolens]|uniref:F-box/LRR-repeat protein 25-like n=1 Tax=Apium graveolens TaxID=4045 RepID=UPI003D7A309A
MKTVGRTCVLSKRWKHVWTYLADLDFNDPETCCAQLNLTCYAQPEMAKFGDRVNRVIIANRATYLDTFRIQFPLSTSYAAHIHNWLKFVFDKQVGNLDLDFKAINHPTIDILNIYINPSLILNTTLKSLHLRSVTLKGPLLQWVLTNCLNLQRLSLHHCKASAVDDSSTPHQKLVVSSLQLKHLESFNSLKLLNINVLHLSAPNLTSFIFYESEIHVEYLSVPSLVEATFGRLYSHHIFHDLDSLSTFSSQLEKLSIWHVRQYVEGPRQSLGPKDAQIKAISSHQHLKVVEYLGYTGWASAAEFALCLTQHAPMLRRFVFDTRQPKYVGKAREVYTSDRRDQMDSVRRTTELLAKQLRWRQNHVVVVIL